MKRLCINRPPLSDEIPARAGEEEAANSRVQALPAQGLDGGDPAGRPVFGPGRPGLEKNAPARSKPPVLFLGTNTCAGNMFSLLNSLDPG